MGEVVDRIQGMKRLASAIQRFVQPHPAVRLRAALALSLDGTGGAAAIGDLLCDFAKVAGVPANSSGIETTVQRIAALSFGNSIAVKTCVPSGFWTNNNPGFLRDGVYEFNSLHGWHGYASGHTAVTCAVASVLWI